MERPWATACTDLQAALTAATAGTRILVAGGTYKPTSGTDRTLSFQLKSSVDVYGGYAGDLNPSNRGVRDPALYPTILSGDIGTAGDSGDNSYHVVRGGWVDNMTLSGFTITGGNANGSNSPDYSGGGMLNTSAQPTIEGCTFTGELSELGRRRGVQRWFHGDARQLHLQRQYGPVRRRSWQSPRLFRAHQLHVQRQLRQQRGRGAFTTSSRHLPPWPTALSSAISPTGPAAAWTTTHLLRRSATVPSAGTGPPMAAGCATTPPRRR